MTFQVAKTLCEDGNMNFVVIDNEYNIVEEIALYLNWLKTKEMTQGTIEAYCNDLKEFFSWLEAKSLKFYEVSKRDMLSWLDYIDNNIGKRDVKSARTKNRYLASIASFYRYYEGMGGWLDSNPLTIKDSAKSNHYLYHPVNRSTIDFSFFRIKEKKSKGKKRLSRSQIEALYDGIEKVQTDPDLVIRNKLMFRIMYETGCRIGECLGLRLNDFKFPERGKNYGVIKFEKHNPLYHNDHSIKTLERELAVGADLIQSIDEYITYTRPELGKYDTIFVDHRSPSAGKFMTRRPVNSLFAELSEIVGIKCTPHSLRHTHGTELKESGFDAVYIQHRLGHSSIHSTSIYMHPSLEAQAEQYEKFQQQRRSASLQ